jgi:hypothetical protein
MSHLYKMLKEQRSPAFYGYCRMASMDDSTVDALKKLVEVQNRILKDEVRDHLLYMRVMLLTGIALILVGYAVLTYISPIGILLVLFGILRLINSVYDLIREDSLKKKMRLITQTFGDILALTG